MLPFDLDRPPGHTSQLGSETLLSGQCWGELRVFLAVAKAKSFNRAAEMLHTSQPTVSRHVKRLQDVMGSQLLIPTQHGVRLTQRGDELARALGQLDVALFSLTNDLQAESKQAKGVVRIGVPEALSAALLAPSLQRFAAQYPNVQVHLKDPVNAKDFRDAQTDLLLATCALDAADIQCRKIASAHFIPVAAKQYLVKHGVPLPANLERHFFLQSEYYCGKPVWEAWNRAASRGRITHFADNSIAYGRLVEAGLGIGLLGSYSVPAAAVVPLDLGLRVSLPLFAIAFSERLNARPVRLVFDWLRDTFASNPWFSNRFRLHQRARPAIGRKPKLPRRGAANGEVPAELSAATTQGGGRPARPEGPVQHP